MPERIRVVTLIDLIGPIGGAERLAGLLAAGMDRDRFEPIVVVTRFDPADHHHPAQNAAAAELAEQGIDVVGLARGATLDLSPWRRLGALLRGRDVHVLHAHKFGSNVWGSVLGRLAGTPVVVAHEHTWSFEGEPVRKLLDRQLIGRLADTFVAVSQEDRRRMIEIEGIPADRVRYVPNGAPPSPRASGADVRAELGIPADAPIVGSVAMLRAQKAFEVLVDAAARLRESRPDVRVLIAGYGDEREALEARIAEQGLEQTVLLLGHRDDIPDLVRAFDVAVCCSDYEGMPMSVIEYMEASRPVVATRVGGLPDMIEDGVHGLLVPPRDPEALAGALDALLGDPERRAAMGRAAAERREADFGMDTMVRRVEALYEELLAARGSTPSSS